MAKHARTLVMVTALICGWASLWGCKQERDSQLKLDPTQQLLRELGTADPAMQNRAATEIGKLPVEEIKKLLPDIQKIYDAEKDPRARKVIQALLDKAK